MNTEIKEQKGKAEVEVPEGVERMEARKAYVPDVDVVESAQNTVLVADMPGVDAGDVEVTLEKSILTIRGKPAKEKPEGVSLVYSEYGIGDFERSFTISEEIDRENITASINDGVLKVVLSKASPKTKRITVATK